MTFHGNFKLLPMAAALVLATMSMSTQAATEAWVATATQAPRLPASTTELTTLTAGAPMHVVVSLKLRNKADFDTLTNNIVAGRVTQALTNAQFMSSYAPTVAQAQAVVDHLTKSGFRNVTISENRMLVSADGSATTVKTAFNTDIHTYDVAGRAAVANISAAAVPQSLSNIVLAVHGLQTLHLHHVMMVKPNAHTNSTVGHSPTDFAAIYNAAGLPSAVNAKIGIITQGSMTQTLADLRTFASNKGFPPVNVSTVTVGAPSSDTAGTGEWNMDTQDALATAGGTINQMILYTANTLSDADLTSTYNRAVTDNVAKSINVSLGECENDAKASGIMASNDQIFQTAVAQGQTFSVSSGDSGSYECGGPGNSASYPSVSPYVMSIGGTLLNTSGNSYVSESVWACTTAASCQQSAGGGAGGAPSLTEPAPSWQINSGVLGSSTKRGTPDISFDADPTSGALVLVNGSNQQIGGTSLAAPIFTGFWARVQSMNNNSLPFPAAAIYQKAASTPGMFHDVTSGSNGGETARAGWDYASGYGSLNMANFAAAMGNSGGHACNATVINGSATSCTAAGLPNYTGTAYTHVYSTYTGGGTCTPAAAPGFDTSGCKPPVGSGLSNGTPVTGIAVAAGANKMYTIDVPAGQSSLTLDTSGGSGDVDLYVKLGSAPTTASYLQKSDGPSTAEHIAIANPAAGTYYVMVNGYAASSGVSLVGKYAATAGNVLSNGVPVTGLSGAAGSSKVYTLVVPAGRPSLSFKTTGSGDADLYVQLGSAPTTSSYLKSSESSTASETITIASPAAGTYYVMVYGYASYSGLTLTGQD